jgi:hypothetical protein
MQQPRAVLARSSKSLEEVVKETDRSSESMKKAAMRPGDFI